MKRTLFLMIVGVSLFLGAESAIACACSTSDGITFCEPIC